MSGALRVVALALCGGACASGGSNPADAARAYADAVRAGDGDRVHATSAREMRAAMTAEEVSRFLAKNPAYAQRTADELQSVESVVTRAEVHLSSGGVVKLRLEGDRWTVEDSPLALPRLDTPLAALRTFLFAARGHMSMLRATLPLEAQKRLASDAALALHLQEIRDRVLVLEADLPRDPEVIVEGELARVPYGRGRAVVLRREADSWRVLDLE